MIRLVALVFCVLALSAVSASAQSAVRSFSSKIGIHLIGTYTEGTKKMVRARCPVLKILDPSTDMINAARDYKKYNPDGIVVLRCYAPVRYKITDNPEEKAQEYWDTITWARLSKLSEADRKLIDYIEPTNEMGECPTWENEESTAWFTRFSIKFTELCAQHGYRPCLGNIPVGNPPGDNAGIARILQFAPALRAAKKVGGVWSYHCYTIQYTTDPKVEIWYSLRYRKFHDAFMGEYADLADIPMILTEGGVDYQGNPEKDGWSARGSAEKYENWLKWFDSELKKDPYIIGVTLFEQGDPRGWKSFDLESLADWFVQYWNQPKPTLDFEKQ